MCARENSTLGKNMKFTCGFCREELIPCAKGPNRVFGSILGLRQSYCPHCFSVVLVPAGWLAWIVGLFRLVLTPQTRE
jgi:hypothetical protein